MADNNNNRPAFLTVGTPQCGIACAALGAVAAVLILSIGFWKTLFIVVLTLIGLFVGGVKDKNEALKGTAKKVVSAAEGGAYRTIEKKTVKPGKPETPAGDDADGEQDTEDAPDAEDDGDAEDAEEYAEDPEDEDAEDDEDAAEDPDADGEEAPERDKRG